MSTATTPSATKLTAADLLAMPDGKNYELIDGHLEAKNVSYESSRIATRLATFLTLHCDKFKLGPVLGSDVGYQCSAHDSQKIRRADVSFFSLQRLPPDKPDMGFIPFPPDLAVEVVSPNDLVREVNNKVHDYLEAGVRLVWVIDPTTGQVLVYNSTGGKILSSQDELSGEVVIPEVRLKISELLRKPGE